MKEKTQSEDKNVTHYKAIILFFIKEHQTKYMK